jgi:hypothetical protein
MVDRKRSPVVIWILPLIVGLSGLFRVMQSPSFALYRTVDVVQLLGCGVCFGATMVGVISRILGSRV